MAGLRSAPFLLAAVLAAGVAGAPAREIERVFPVRPGCLLKIDTYRGSVAIEEGDDNAIRLTVVVDAGSETDERSRRLADGVEFDFTAQDNTVSLRARNPRESGLRFDWGEEEKVDLRYRIVVPRECSVDLQAGEADVTVGNLSGRMTVRTERGSIFLRRITGTIDARTEVGEIVVSRCSGAVVARVRSGLIRLGTIGGPLEARNSSGSIEVLTAHAGIVAAAEAGNIDVGIGPRVSADSRLSVSGGNILARIHPEAACRIEASSTWGRVTSSLPLAIAAGASGERRLAGHLNRAGPLISLHASGGSVRLSPDVVLIGQD